MEDGLGNILYIILTIVFIVAGLIRKNKKPDISTPPPVFQDEETPSFETIFETIKKQMAGQEDESPVPPPAVKEISVPKRNFMSKLKEPIVPEGSMETFDTMEGQSLENTDDADSPIYAKAFDLTSSSLGGDENADNTGISELLKDPDEMRRAIIYAEILTPKYKYA